MKKALLLMALFAGSLLGANAQDHLTAFLKPGNAVLGIQLKNAETYTAFQMDIKLPEGMTLSTDADAVTIQRQGQTAAHEVYKNVTSEGILKVASFSYDGSDAANLKGNDSFTGSKGDLLLIKVSVADNCIASGVEISNVEFVKTTGLVAEKAIGLAAKGKFGDTDGNNKVDTNDAISGINHFLSDTGTLTAAQQEISDINDDAKVDTNDAIKIIEVFLNY
jgi:hypothetical protein